MFLCIRGPFDRLRAGFDKLSPNGLGIALRAPAPSDQLDPIQSVLHAPVFTSAGVNRLAAAALNSSWPAGIGRVIQ